MGVCVLPCHSSHFSSVQAVSLTGIFSYTTIISQVEGESWVGLEAFSFPRTRSILGM